jgi:uncharacterized protein YlzI (FlbEa/FlbD family)
MFIKLTNKNGRAVLFNMRFIAAVVDEKDGATLTCEDGESCGVQESLDEICALLAEASK